ncbi:cysteine desulfurase family protein [Mesorhizobium sp. YIM 152430]|uniref:cysteine desulfurase family protein n=1 Tax=Mesorhizobium sp. YIM 152430 TaxID=3031761 RepID=UPI0023DA428E|nr:cysteine desulfurase family protein [Mesorhizobium sp. YIM 152430]MDF1601484.1 cysteine desulfurase family protein [Mesorhizobium sp. YIM 152430]
MTGRRFYLDWNASAPLLPEAKTAMVAALDLTANPSSVHAEGRQARRLIEEARRDVAAMCNAKPDHVIFTSGASEAVALVLTPDWRMGRSPLRYSRLYTSTTDHTIVVGGGRFAMDDIVELPVGSDGVLDLDALKTALDAHDRSTGLPLVAVHLANNETGVIQPAAKIAAIVHEAGGVLVLDAVQAGGRISLDIAALCADFLILAAHKIGGPKGAGALVGNSDVLMPTPIATGGGQERGHRAGTENYAALAGFGAAARSALAVLPQADALRAKRDRIETAIRARVPEAVIFGDKTERLPNTVFFGIPGVKAETAQIAFDLAGISVSSGSACSSGKVGASRVLKAMGHGEDVSGIRVSIGHWTGDEEIAAFATALEGFMSRRKAAA